MGERLDDAVDKAGDIVDRTANRLSSSSVPKADTRTDVAVLRIFPAFVLVCLTIWSAGLLVIDWSGISKPIELLCLSFTLCFAVLGSVLFFKMPQGVFRKICNAMSALILTAVIWISDYLTGDFYFSDTITGMIEFMGWHLSSESLFVIGFAVTYCVLLFTATAVVSVVCIYLRRYVPQVLSTMNEHAKKGIRSKSERFFMVPDIIDVESIKLIPPRREHVFDIKGFLSITSYIFILGLLISSYLFVNPYFLDVMDEKVMLAITLMLSMFTPVLIIPWQTFRTIGAVAESGAPRPYPLWQGAKFRLFTTFTTMGAFMMMFLLSVYLGNDVWRIIRTYLTFMIPLLCTSVMYGIVYTNNFESADIDEISRRFEEQEAGNRNAEQTSSKGGKRQDYRHRGLLLPLRILFLYIKIQEESIGNISLAVILRRLIPTAFLLFPIDPEDDGNRYER